MDLQLVYLLAGLIVIGMALPGLIVPAEAKISRGTLVQFLYGVILVVLYFVQGGKFV